MPFIPHSKQTIDAMCQQVGAKSIDDLFDEIPQSLRLKNLALPSGKPQWEVQELLEGFARGDEHQLNFAGAGAYDHTIPAAVWALAGRGEYLTAYTPYQAEASQGTLQVIYEYQSLMARLLDAEIMNASMYDGASALAEAALMACRIKKNQKEQWIGIPKNLHPHYQEVVKTYLSLQNIGMTFLPFDSKTGLLDHDFLLQQLKEGKMTAVVVNQPNFFGLLEDTHEITKLCEAHGVLSIACVNPIAMSVLTPPGKWGEHGADIVCGDGQGLGLPLSAGGPYFGFMGSKKEFVRNLPGRLVAKSTDHFGREGFTLTLQAREQHIRRGKATSNICTNQGLLVTAATIYLSLMGAEGLRRVANQSHLNACALQDKLAEIGIYPKYNGSFFLEQVYLLPSAAEPIIAQLAKKEIISGVALGRWYQDFNQEILIATTENKTEHKQKAFVAALKSAL